MLSPSCVEEDVNVGKRSAHNVLAVTLTSSIELLLLQFLLRLYHFNKKTIEYFSLGFNSSQRFFIRFVFKEGFLNHFNHGFSRLTKPIITIIPMKPIIRSVYRLYLSG